MKFMIGTSDNEDKTCQDYSLFQIYNQQQLSF